MRKSIFVSSLIFSCVAFSAPPEITDVPVMAGVFSYQNQFEAERLQEKIEVNMETEEGEEKLDQLMNQNYYCTPTLEHQFVCLKAMTVPRVPDDLVLAVKERMKPFKIDFRTIYDETKMIFIADFARAFRVYQKIIVGSEQILTDAIYNWNSAGRWYIAVRVQGNQELYDYVSGTELTRNATVDLLRSQDEVSKTYHSYSVKAHLVKE